MVVVKYVQLSYMSAISPTTGKIRIEYIKKEIKTFNLTNGLHKGKLILNKIIIKNLLYIWSNRKEGKSNRIERNKLRDKELERIINEQKNTNLV